MSRIRQLAERYTTPLPDLTTDLAAVAAQVDEHLKKDGGSVELKPGYKDTDIGMIPDDWDVKKLGDIGESLIGLTYDPMNVKPDGLLVLRSSNVQESNSPRDPGGEARGLWG